MKKLITYASIIALGIVSAVSCDINKYPTFDDSNAFVAFNKATYSVDENYSDDGTVLYIPVTLASVAGLEETISYKIIDEPNTYTKVVKGQTIDITAKRGVNFDLVDGAGTLSFTSDDEGRTQSIPIKILNVAGQYTGDLKFRIEFDNTGNVHDGAANTCVITICDLDHPLSAILGAYTATGDNYWNGPSSWTMTLKKDATDDSKVWFDNINNLGSWAGDDVLYYGVVDADLTTITIPFGQTSEYTYSNGKPITLLGFDGDGGFDEGSMTVKILDGGKNLDFGTEWGLWNWIEGAGNLVITKPGITAVKN